MGISHAEIVFALDAIQDPVSLYEPIYNDGGDPIFVMDQISDDKNKEDTWDDKLSLKEGMHQLSPREKLDRKSTRLNSSHVAISYAVFCLKKKKNNKK